MKKLILIAGLLLIGSNGWVQVTDEIHERCKAAADYVGCVEANKNNLLNTESDYDVCLIQLNMAENELKERINVCKKMIDENIGDRNMLVTYKDLFCYKDLERFEVKATQTKRLCECYKNEQEDCLNTVHKISESEIQDIINKYKLNNPTKTNQP